MLCLRLGGVCNDLSDHEATLGYMEHATSLMSDHKLDDQWLRRQIWYYCAVSYSNLGQSERCLQEYYKMVDSCPDLDDELACLSLGYLAHDLKYRDLETAIELGQMAMEWADERGLTAIQAKNMCSYAESLLIAGRVDEATALFSAALRVADRRENKREAGRIATNLGFALAKVGAADAEKYLNLGRENSSTMGDRRRQTQALLYTGVLHQLRGSPTGACG